MGGCRRGRWGGDNQVEGERLRADSQDPGTRPASTLTGSAPPRPAAPERRLPERPPALKGPRPREPRWVGLATLQSVSRSSRLVAVLALNIALVTALILVGISAHSIGVLAEGADYLADAAAIGVSLLAIWLSKRPPTERRPAGYPKATTIAALVNGGWLLILSILVFAGAVSRLATTTRRVHGLPVLIVSGIAAVVMLGGTLILRGDVDDDGDDDGGDLNIRAVLLDTAADAAAAAGVAISGGVILAAGGLYWLDPTVALIIAIVVAYHTLRLLTKVVRALGSVSAR